MTMKPRRGFSLVELLVALVLSGILMAGMAKIFASSISSFYTTGELVGAQRRNRWILNELGDDLRMAGHTDGFDTAKVPQTLPESPFVITPGTVAGSNRDQVDLFMNEPVQELTVNAAAAQAATGLSLVAVGGGSLNIHKGDFLIIKDGIQAEYAIANADVSSGSVALMDETSQQMDPAIAGYMKYGSVALQRAHAFGGQVTVLRPCQLIHYGVEDRLVDPSDSSNKIPCLIRKQAPFGSGAQADWSKIAGEVVAENVSALRLDLSVDGGVSWERGNTWAATVALANGRLNAANQITSNSFWFKRVPALIRVEIRSRTPLARTEYASTAGTAAFRERTQVLVIAPRNFASPL
jgi:prepilin-type N-terminal cleavage/methylation domain-containing protein